MSLFDEMLKNENYMKLFENLPAEERAILMNSMRQMVEEVEQKFIDPLKSLANKNNPENDE